MFQLLRKKISQTFPVCNPLGGTLLHHHASEAPSGSLRRARGSYREIEQFSALHAATSDPDTDKDLKIYKCLNLL